MNGKRKIFQYTTHGQIVNFDKLYNQLQICSQSLHAQGQNTDKLSDLD